MSRLGVIVLWCALILGVVALPTAAQSPAGPRVTVESFEVASSVALPRSRTGRSVAVSWTVATSDTSGDAAASDRRLWVGVDRTRSACPPTPEEWAAAPFAGTWVAGDDSAGVSVPLGEYSGEALLRPGWSPASAGVWRTCGYLRIDARDGTVPVIVTASSRFRLADPAVLRGQRCLRITPSTYVARVGRASVALIRFGEILQSVRNVADVRRSERAVRRELARFNAAMRSLRGACLENRTLERQRSRLVGAWPAVARNLDLFVDAMVAGDLDRAEALLPRVRRALDDFQKAAAG